MEESGVINSPATFERSVVMFSVIPAEIYACALSFDRFAKGKTAIEGFSVVAGRPDPGEA